MKHLHQQDILLKKTSSDDICDTANHTFLCPGFDNIANLMEAQSLVIFDDIYSNRNT